MNMRPVLFLVQVQGGDQEGFRRAALLKPNDGGQEVLTQRGLPAAKNDEAVLAGRLDLDIKILEACLLKTWNQQLIMLNWGPLNFRAAL